MGAGDNGEVEAEAAERAFDALAGGTEEEAVPVGEGASKEG
jgi:hypothetical protein